MPRRTNRQKATTGGNPKRSLIAIYALLLIVMLALSFLPEIRLWGLSWWAYLPLWSRAVLLGAAVGGGILAQRLSNGSTNGHRYPLIGAMIFVAMVAAMSLLPARTHFLGDGYQLLSSLADQTGSVKAWDYGASYINQLFYSMLPGSAAERALLTYRVVSVGAGAVAVLAVIIVAGRLYRRLDQRLVFVAGFASCGVILLFFGYVENYALSTTAAIIFGLVGLMHTDRGLSRVWLFPTLIAALFMHLFMAVMVPAFVYLLLHDTAWMRRLDRLSNRAKLVAVAVLVAAGAAVYVYLYSHYYFFTFAFLPLLPTEFTVDGDWLFSGKHLIDVVNLALMMVPGLPLLVMVWWPGRRAGGDADAGTRFLVVWLMTAGLAVFLLNPGIGMPRNWDLFSAAGIPLVLLAYRFVCRAMETSTAARFAAVLAVVLGVIVLTPRVVSQVSPDIAIARIYDYIEFDKTRNRNTYRLLRDYYESIGDTTRAEQARTEAEREYPETVYHANAEQLLAGGRRDQAKQYWQRALDANPLYYNAYASLGACLLQEQKTDSAGRLLRIADGLNPYNATVISNLGTLHLRQEDYDRAIEYFREALRIDSAGINARAGLASAHLIRGEFSESIRYVSELANVAGMPPDYFREAGDSYLAKGAFVEARRAYEFAISKGLDPNYVRQKQQAHPELKP